MKISVITVVRNRKDTIKDAIESVLSQTHQDTEYIVVDGASDDGTTEIIRQYQDKISKFISEPDKGIYDAMNKGIKLATGDVIGILNGDDLYASDDILETVAKEFMGKNIDCLYGDLVYVDTKDTSKVIRYWKSSSFTEGLFKKGWHPPHPTFFARRRYYEEYGYFNLDLKIAADYELMLRFLERHKLNSVYLPRVMVKMRIGGESNKSIKNIIRANIECYKAWKINKMNVSPLMVIRKPLSKVMQLATAKVPI
ncbi:MAG: glycosyltransferase [Geminocystis sp.]|nr:glycosyltransferase [Geminocystis sp.]HIK38818.1 glycosyltransferase [Geminocystis sp. M7585_C2015_104]MCS7146556.1 glycosyltransferase [Geminocystis sp.]MCX8078631.1 glycosyltransferase [Geminocystis sp.]MDW8117325.1 glycosyltransferase family 2 protein [Geminocystis sp.]